MWPGPRPISVPSFILIHPTIWLQYTNITDRQTGQWSIAQGEPFYKRLPQNYCAAQYLYLYLHSTVLVNSQHLPANLLDAILESKLMSFMYTVPAEYWGVEPLEPHEVGTYDDFIFLLHLHI